LQDSLGDVTFASQLLQIEPRWLPKLPIGSGIARLPVRFYTPILFTFSPQPIKNLTITDDEVHQQWRRCDLPLPTDEPRAPPALNSREEELLHDVAARPISTITKRYERLGWNAKTGNSIKDSVIAKGFATFDPVVTPGQVKILSLTAQARDVLERAGITIPRKHGGPEHEYWKAVIADHLRRQGFSVTEEYPVGGGKTVDLFASRGDQRVMIEVETGRSDIPANVEKCAGQDAAIIFAFTSAQVRAAHEAMIRAALPAARLLTASEARALRW